MEIREQAKVIADELRGTCDGCVDDKIEEHGFADVMALHYALDDLIFNCVRCGWWCEIAEAVETDGEFYCDQCADEELN
jgi:hypothetical protein